MMKRVLQFLIVLMTVFFIPIVWNNMHYNIWAARDILFTLYSVLLFGIYICFYNDKANFPRWFFYFMIWVIISYTLNFFRPALALFYFMKGVYAFILIYALYGLIKGKDIPYLLNAICLAVMIQIIWLILQAWNIDPIHFAVSIGGNPNPTARDPLVGFMGNGHLLALLIAISTPFFIRKQKIAILLPFIGLCVLQSTLGFISAIVGVFIYYLFALKQKKYLRYILIGLFVSGIAYLKFIDMPNFERVKIWEYLIISILKAPFFRLIWGYGLGTLTNMRVGINRVVYSQPHSDLLSLILEIGMIPVILFIGSYILSKVKIAWQLRNDEEANKLFASFCIIVMSFLFSFPFHIPTLAFISLIIIAMLEVKHKERNI